MEEVVVEAPVAEEVKPVEVIEPKVVEQIDEPELFVYRVTAYCPCEICCGEWAKKRPLDEYGNPIVVGAWGRELVDGYSVASPIAFGTTIELEDIGLVEVQDRTAKWIVEEYGEYILDLYMTDHNAAKEFGVKYIRGVVK